MAIHDPVTLAATSLAVAAGLTSLVVVRAAAISPWRIGRTTLDVPVPGLDAAFDGYTIAALTDLHHHAGAAPSIAQVERAVAIANDARPDLVVLLGDYGVSFEPMPSFARRFYPRALADLAVILGRLRATDGMVGVVGNHDHYFDAGRVREWLAGLGARVIENDHLLLRRGAASLVVAGVGDVWEGQVDYAGAVGGAPAAAPVVLLSHNPDAVLHLGAAGAARRPALVLAGHTHGGQVVLPFVGAPVRESRVCGRHTAGGWVPNPHAPLYVSRGVGGQIPLRFGCEPEVVVVRLRPAPPAA